MGFFLPQAHRSFKTYYLLLPYAHITYQCMCVVLCGGQRTTLWSLVCLSGFWEPNSGSQVCMCLYPLNCLASPKLTILISISQFSCCFVWLLYCLLPFTHIAFCLCTLPSLFLSMEGGEVGINLLGLTQVCFVRILFLLFFACLPNLFIKKGFR